MGYRERRAHKQQQKQQSLGQSYTPEQRITLPTPTAMNARDSVYSLQPNEAALIEDFYNSERGLIAKQAVNSTKLLPSATAAAALALINYEASGTTSAEMWAITDVGSKTRIYNVGEIVNLVQVTASGISAPSASSPGLCDWTVFNNNVLVANRQKPWRWSRADGWGTWTASVSAAGYAINDLIGINSFKQKLYAWALDDPIFFYGSTDAVLPIFHKFDLSTITQGKVKFMTSVTRDGGAGPDDYAAFVMDNGDVIVYQGNDPGDANNWSLVGVYKIGRPVGTQSYVKYGNQVVILCEDDFYFIPSAFEGRQSGTKALGYRAPDLKASNGVHWASRGLIVWSDGSVLDVNRGMAYTTMSVCSAPPLQTKTGPFLNSPRILRERPILATFERNLFSLGGTSADGTPITPFYYVDKDSTPIITNQSNHLGMGTFHTGRIKTGPINTPGRTNISLVNPVFKWRALTDEVLNPSVSADRNIKYRTAVVYDQAGDVYYSASANAWVTTSTSIDSDGQWTPAFGTGDIAQIYIEVLSASCSGELLLEKINITVSDTGGI